MSEKSPSTNHENEADYSSFVGIATDFYDRYVGDVTPADVAEEDKNAWRDARRAELADKMANISADIPQEERVAAYGKLIEELKVLGGKSAAEAAVDAQATEDKEAQDDTGATNKRSLFGRIRDRLTTSTAEAAMLQNGQYRNGKIRGAAEKFTKRKEDETEAQYNKRVNRRAAVFAVLGVAAIAVGTKYAISNIDSVGDMFNGDAAMGGHDDVHTGEMDHSFGDHDSNADHDGGDVDREIGGAETYEQSIQTERDFLLENGRIGNDFNNIDTFSGQENIMSELEEQYTKSPAELSGQLYQIQGIEDAPLDLLPEHLQLQDGESYEAYTARLGEELHRNPELHDQLVGYTVDYIDGNFNLQDMPEYYQAAYIDENGVTHWDTQVTSADPNDRIIMLGEGQGIRMPCGQPVRFEVGTPAVEAGMGGPAPVAMSSEYTSTPVTPEYTGVGGPPPENPYTPPVTPPETPYTPPETPPEVPPEVPPVPPETPPETPPENPPEQPPETPLEPKSENPDDYKHIEGAPLAEFDSWAPPAQVEQTPPSVIEQTPSQEIDYGTPAAQAPEAEVVTPEENQQRIETPAAEGATTPDAPGTETQNPF